MQVDIKHTSDPYVLDFILGYDKMPALTRKNANFIEAVVNLDSNYAKDSQIIPPDEKFDVNVHFSNAEGRFCGSTAYWFKKLKDKEIDFRTGILGAIVAIDTVNSTHLEAAKDGRLEMRERICTRCANVNELILELNKEYSINVEDHLISLLTKSIPAKGKNGERYNLSFASKFCSYASIYLGTEVQYSKYDNVVSDALPYYEEVYLGVKRKKTEYKVNQNASDKFSYLLDLYKRYSKCIEKILAETDLNKEELDHIIWYGYKGR